MKLVVLSDTFIADLSPLAGQISSTKPDPKDLQVLVRLLIYEFRAEVTLESLRLDEW
jgi:hypothetical protein